MSKIEKIEEAAKELNKQVNTYLEMLANETKKRIPDSKGSTVWEKSLTEKLAKAKDIIRDLLEWNRIYGVERHKYQHRCNEAEAFLKECGE